MSKMISDYLPLAFLLSLTFKIGLDISNVYIPLLNVPLASKTS